MIVQLSSEERRKIQDLVHLLLEANYRAEYDGLKLTPDEERRAADLAQDIDRFIR